MLRLLPAVWLVVSLVMACGPAPVVADCSIGSARVEIAQSEMTPTVDAGDVVAVSAIGPTGPARGDIVLVDWAAWTGDPGPTALFRVIGIAGDHVELRDGRVLLNGAPQPEPYIPTGMTTEPLPDQPAAWDVPAGALFVLGDARPTTADSRSYGAVPVAALVGRTTLRCGPAGREGPIA